MKVWYRVAATVEVCVEDNRPGDTRLGSRVALDEVAVILAREVVRRRDAGEPPIRYRTGKATWQTAEEAGIIR